MTYFLVSCFVCPIEFIASQLVENAIELIGAYFWVSVTSMLNLSIELFFIKKQGIITGCIENFEKRHEVSIFFPSLAAANRLNLARCMEWDRGRQRGW